MKKMAVPTGIEPAISCVTGRHVNRYTTGPLKNNGGGGGIRTPAGGKAPVGFQDRSLQPDLGTPPNKYGSGGGDRTPDLTGMNRTL